MTVAAVPQSVVKFQAIGSLVVHQQHVALVAHDVRHHAVAPCALFHMPDNLRVGLVALELGAASCPELREIELEGFPLIPEGGEQLPR